MSFLAFWTLIPHFEHFWYLPTPAKWLSLSHQLARLPQRFLFPHNVWSIALSLHYSESLCVVFSQPQATYCIMNCTMLQGLGLFLRPSCSCLHPLDDIIMSRSWSIYCICSSEVAKCSFSECWPLNFVFTLFLGNDIRCWKIWTIWRQSALVMPRTVQCINRNKATSAFWLSLNLE